MKKNTKGAIAAGAAALLLAGGAGTFAAWSDSASLGGDVVRSGQLQISETTPGTWTWGSGGPFSPSVDLIVPGDTVAYTASYKLDVAGTNLVAELTPSLGGVTGGLANYLEVDASSNTSDITLNNITPSDNGKTVSVTTTITFKADTMNQDGMNSSATLAGSTITLEQTAPAGPVTP